MRGQRPFPPYRVEVNVSADGPEVALILDQSGLEAALGEVARSPMPLGVPVGVSGDEVLHAPRQVGLRCTEEEVEVVGHEHETEQVPTEPPDRLLQCVWQISLAGSRGVWSALPFLSARRVEKGLQATGHLTDLLD